MLTRLRHRAHGQEGFTLIELLVVILIIGILAAVAIPAFLNQKGKAQDANVKSDINTAQTAEETYSTNSNSPRLRRRQQRQRRRSDERRADPQERDRGYRGADRDRVWLCGGPNAYTITANSPSGVNYSLIKSATGTIQRQCTVTSAAQNSAGCNSGSW